MKQRKQKKNQTHLHRGRLEVGNAAAKINSQTVEDDC